MPVVMEETHEKALRIIFNPEMFVQPLSLEKPVLRGSRCRECGRTYFPKRTICTDCRSDENMEEVPLSRYGQLYCYTVVYAAPEGFIPPYAFGLVVLPEGLRLFSIIQDCEPFDARLKIGMEVELDFGAIARNEAGEDVYNYVFKPSRRRE